jgi:ribosomal protein S6--L-glutamate ligase
MALVLTLGWQEWVALPDLGIPALKAKIDTGARTSALHATEISVSSRGNARIVKFVVWPVPRRPTIRVDCTAPLLDERTIVSSNGESERRAVIEAQLSIGGMTWPIEVTLTDRAQMRTRMLIGRQALAGRALIDPGRSFVQGRLSLKAYRSRGSAPSAW